VFSLLHFLWEELNAENICNGNELVDTHQYCL
jgi:hypothetical protein